MSIGRLIGALAVLLSLITASWAGAADTQAALPAGKPAVAADELKPAETSIEVSRQPIVPAGQSVSLAAAVERALSNQAALRLARERVKEAGGRLRQSQADLLPQADLKASQTRVFHDSLYSKGLAGELGPFSSFDGRAQISQRIFDLAALSRWQSGEREVRVARFAAELARQQVIAQTILFYIEADRQEENFQAVEEDYKLAAEIQQMAERQFAAGIVTKLDVARADTRLAREKAIREEARLGLNAAYFQLERVTGLSLDMPLRLQDKLRLIPENIYVLSDVLPVARQNRIELKLAAE
ncbi:MAG: TolC family protein, partial [Candidatus Omnitrophica bacterium]|nr:TolC family protein [Candidatus Omnitrophota bacterium]